MSVTTTPAPPNAVRVWRGYRLPTLTLKQFTDDLAKVFIPATVKMQIDVGLHSYVPTVPAGMAGKPDTVPDETAILFWESQATYWNGFNTLAVRTYTLTHNGVYVTANQKSRADFPELFAGSLVSDAPVYLFDKAVDWTTGNVTHLVGARPAAQGPADFHAAVAAALGKIQTGVSLDGAIACVGDDYLVYWELVPVNVGGPTPPSGIPLLEPLVDWNNVFTPGQTFLPVGLWEPWMRMDVQSGSSFNMQFDRRKSPAGTGETA